MTIICDLSCDIDIKVLSENFKSPSYPVCTLVKTKEHDEYELTRRGKTRKSFYNQTTIQYTDHTTKSIKVFSNGRLQMTGLTSITEALQAAHILCDILKSTPFSLKSPCDGVSNLYIGMINSNFCIQSGINIIQLKSLANDLPDVHVRYDPNVYPGLKIKVKNEDNSMTSCFVFGTGNVLITGAKHLTHIHNTFKIISSLIVNNPHVLIPSCVQPVYKKVKDHSILYKSGYPAHLYNCCN